jgi:hypothetical protein
MSTKIPVLSVYDEAGNRIPIPAIRGKSAYAYAQDGGYTGTEEDFAKKLAQDVPEGGGSGGDYIPVPATASVGQTIKVSAVDENGKPTAWEAADFPEGGGGWKLLGDITLEESEVAQVDFTEDMDGNPLSYESVYIVVFGVASQASGWNANIACSTHPNYQDTHHSFALAGNCLATSGVWGAVTIEHISGVDWKATAVKFPGSSVTSGTVQTYDGLGRTAYANWQAKADGPIRKVRITPFAGTFSSGFRAILYGR